MQHQTTFLIVLVACFSKFPPLYRYENPKTGSDGDMLNYMDNKSPNYFLLCLKIYDRNDHLI